MINSFQDITGAIIISFPTPDVPLKKTVKLSKSSTRSLNGTPYAYGRSLVTRSFPLTISKVSSTILNQLESFFRDTVAGPKVPFRWFDYDGRGRQVTLQGHMDYVPTGPDKFRVSLTLLEQFMFDPYAPPPYILPDYVGTEYVQT